MIDLIAIITRGALALAPVAAPVAPASAPVGVAHLATIPLFGAPAAVATQPAPPAAPMTATDVVNRVQTFYGGIKQVTATFRQNVTNSTFGSTGTSDGQLIIAKPGKMRWDYNAKKNGVVTTKKSFISNGTSLWVVEHDNKQVMEKDLKNDLMPVVVSFLYGKGDLNAEFNAALDTTNKYGAKGDYVLKLTPKQPSAQYKALYLVVTPDGAAPYHVKQSVIVDSSDNVNDFQFFNPDFEKPVKTAWFEFDPKSEPTYRVINGNAPAPAAPAKP